MGNKRVSLDIGRSRWKSAMSNSHTKTVVAGLAQLSENDYNRAMQRGASKYDFMEVGGSFYAVGEQSLGYRSAQELTAATRYNRIDMGVPAVNMIMRLSDDYFEIDETEREITLDVVVSHPPDDADFVGELKNSILGDWSAFSGSEHWLIHIERVFTYDEPIAILMNSLLTVQGTSYRQRPEGSILVPDMGGDTLDITASLANGTIMQAGTKSDKIGVNEIQRQFFESVRANNPDIFMGQSRVSQHLIQDAFMTGYFKGGKTIDCRAEMQRYRDIYLHDFIEFVRRTSGGLLNYSTVILGGGGAAIFADDLMQILDHDNIIFADDNLAQIHTAGVRGMLKVANLWESMGLI